MDQTRLQNLLADLHRELSGAGSVDPESRRLIEQVLSDIRHLVPESAGQDAGGPAAELREAALRIESEHPRLATALGQLADTLAKLGS
jgi:hypothetical protein